MKANTRLVGKNLPATDALNKICGKTKYAADYVLPGMLIAKTLRSPHAHAKIISIDTSEAEKMPGVKAIAHCFNAPDYLYNRLLKNYDYTDKDQVPTEYIYPKVVRFVGEHVAGVAAETEAQAKEALKKIKVEYEVLPTVLTIEEALDPNSIPLHDNVGNVLTDFSFPEDGNVEEGMKSADYVFEDVYRTPAVNQVAIETHACIADYDHEGKCTIITATQSAFSVRALLSRIFDITMNNIRLIKPPLGGGFGAKIPAILEPQAMLLSKLAGRPVKLMLTRKESFLVNSRHESKIRIKTGVQKDGTIIAQEVDSIINTGAHASDGRHVAGALGKKAYFMYKIPNIKVRTRCVFTNQISAGAMRGYGSPQIFFAQQSQMHKIATTLGMDLVALQEKNAINKEFHKGELGNTQVLECIQKGKELFEWNRRRKTLEATSTIKRGIGMSIACHGNGLYKLHRDFAGITLKANEDGTFSMHSGAHEMGTGLLNIQRMLVAETLGIDLDKIAYIECDTDVVPHNIGDYASRGVFVQGNAAIASAEKMKNELQDIASKMWDCNADDITLDEGGILRNGNLLATFSEVVLYAYGVLQKTVFVEASYANEATRVSYGAHFAEVEVNTETNEVRVLDYVAVHDVGRVMSRSLVEGQLEGGIQMGLGFALTEKYDIDAMGVLKNPNLKKYKVFKAKDMPNIRTDFVESIDYPGPFGGKSIGECATNPVAPAVANAIADAMGTEYYELPIKVG